MVLIRILWLFRSPSKVTFPTKFDTILREDSQLTSNFWNKRGRCFTDSLQMSFFFLCILLHVASVKSSVMGPQFFTWLITYSFFIVLSILWKCQRDFSWNRKYYQINQMCYALYYSVLISSVDVLFGEILAKVGRHKIETLRRHLLL